MKSIALKSYIGADGILKLQLPLGLSNTEVEVMVIVQPLAPAPTSKTTEELGWPPGFFEQTFGCLKEAPLMREPQGEYEIREELR